MANKQRFGNFRAVGNQVEVWAPFETREGGRWWPMNHAPITAKAAREGAKMLAEQDKARDKS
jgi:hypothetical protein